MKQLKNNHSYKIAVLPGDGIGPDNKLKQLECWKS